MLAGLLNLCRLARAGIVLSGYADQYMPPGVTLPLPARLGLPILKALGWFAHAKRPEGVTPLAADLSALGPSYIKLGQFLATRPDLVGKPLAAELSGLQDRMPPFGEKAARARIAASLGRPVDELYAEFGPPIAAASMAQVHKAAIIEDGVRREVAVKVLRPGIETRFAHDLGSFDFAARMIERLDPKARRLKPVVVVETLRQSIGLEMDFRMEAAAISEMADNVKGDLSFRVPTVDWPRTTKDVLTIEWIDGIPIGHRDELVAAGHDIEAIGVEVIRSFLRHAMRDGFFHADMHQGNLFVDPEGQIVAVDFGIMGRLSPKERRFLAEILLGFITRDYRRAAAAHFAAGYVPPKHSVEVFAQALRAIGEPLMGRPSNEISMGHLLGQLFEYTEVFDMETRPELLLLQKTMVVVEGVARTLDERLNMWTAAEPVVKEWMERQLGLEGRLDDARQGAGQLGEFASGLPAMLLKAERAADDLATMAGTGLRLDDETVRRLAAEQSRAGRSSGIAIWLVAAALIAGVFVLWFGP